MNRGEAFGPGGRRGSRGRSKPFSDMVYRPKSQSPVTVDRSLDESSGNSGRGSRGRGRSKKSWSAGNSSAYAYDDRSPVQMYVKKSSQEDEISSTKQPEEGATFKFSGDNKDLFQSSASSSLTDLNISGGSFVSSEYEDKDLLQSFASSSLKDLNISGGSFVSSECEDKDDARCEGNGINLGNQVKDDALYYAESVSSTRDRRVEISKVRDYGNAHKSGDSVNSSNESKSGTFDLFLSKKGMVLKPSMFNLNREKRKADKGYTGRVIRPGMVLLKNYLSINDQVMIVNKCRQLGMCEGGFYQPGYRDGALLRLKMMCLGKNWDPETSQYGETRPVDNSTPPKIPFEFKQFVEKAIKESQSIDEMPFMVPDICIVNFYTSTGRLGLHQDKDESENSIRKGLPVVSFSIGDSADFLYSDQRDDDMVKSILLESGDVLLFGGKSRNIFHGVRSIHKDTAPKVLVQETNLRPGRLNLTCRQY